MFCRNFQGFIAKSDINFKWALRERRTNIASALIYVIKHSARCNFISQTFLSERKRKTSREFNFNFNRFSLVRRAMSRTSKKIAKWFMSMLPVQFIMMQLLNGNRAKLFSIRRHLLHRPGETSSAESARKTSPPRLKSLRQIWEFQLERADDKKFISEARIVCLHCRADDFPRDSPSPVVSIAKWIHNPRGINLLMFAHAKTRATQIGIFVNVEIVDGGAMTT